MNRDDDRMPYFDDEEVVGSAQKFHRPSCQAIRNINRRNIKRFRSWQGAAAVGLDPCGICRPFHNVTPPPPPLPTSAAAPAPVTIVLASTLADWRRNILRILDTLDEGSDRSMGVAARIKRLTEGSVIPMHIAMLMRVVTEMRNATEYNDADLTQAQRRATSEAYSAVLEWAEASVGPFSHKT